MVLRKYISSSYAETKRLISEGDNLLEPITFREKLYVFNENGERMGRFSLNIDQEETNCESHKILYVHISNRAFIDGRLSESIVTGTITHKLKTLEEYRYEETEVLKSGKHERCLFLLREKNQYYVSVTTSIGELKNQSHTTIPLAETIGLIGESANAVLMRKLAIKGYEGILCLQTILPNGKLYKSYYVTKLSQQIVNGKKIQVLVVYRNVTNHKKSNVTMTMALTRAGQIIYLFWSNSKYFLHVDPDVEINTSRHSYAESGLHNHWHKDIQLHSLYLDRVDGNLITNRSFKYERDELRRILEDFVEYILIFKPENIICFAIQFFTAFGHNTMRKCSSKIIPEGTIPEETEDRGEYEHKDEEQRSYMEWQGETGFF